jgi:protein-tyrosine phosphatase
MSALARLYTVQGLSSGKMSIMPRPRGGDWLADELKMLFFDGVDVLVSLLTSGEAAELDLQDEAECCRRQSIVYLSYPIPDLTTPPFTPDTFALLEQLKAYLARGKHVVAHCRMGLGRSALIAASTLVLAGFTPEYACAQLSAVRGYTVPEMEEQRAWVKALPEKYAAYLRALDLSL